MLNFKIWKLLITVISVLLCELARADTNFLEQIYTIESNVNKSLARPATNADVSVLDSAHKLVLPLEQNHGKPYWVSERSKILRLRLRVMEQCHEMRKSNSKEYNNSEVPVLRANSSGRTPPFFSGMDPKAIDDPADRKLYEDWVAEKAKRKHDYQAKQDLQRFYERNIWELIVYLESIDNNPQLNVADDFATIKSTIENEKLCEEIFKQIADGSKQLKQKLRL